MYVMCLVARSSACGLDCLPLLPMQTKRRKLSELLGEMEAWGLKVDDEEIRRFLRDGVVPWPVHCQVLCDRIAMAVLGNAFNLLQPLISCL